MNNISTAYRQCAKQIAIAFSIFSGGMMTEKKPILKTTRRYGNTLYIINTFGAADGTETYEDCLLQLIQMEAEKTDNDPKNTCITTKQEKGE